MEFLVGLLAGAVFFVGLTLAYKAGQRVKKPPSQADDEEKRKAEKLRKGFVELMNYDVNKALERKKVM